MQIHLFHKPPCVYGGSALNMTHILKKFGNSQKSEKVTYCQVKIKLTVQKRSSCLGCDKIFILTQTWCHIAHSLGNVVSERIVLCCSAE